MEHSKLSASSSHRWIRCPGSVEASKNYKNQENSFTKEGILAHLYAERCLKNKKNANKYIGDITEDMAKHIQSYLNYVRAHMRIGCKMYIEKEVKYALYLPKNWGTVDCIIVNSDTIHVFDLKYGQGIKINAVDNSQLLMYALGTHLKYNDNNLIKKFVLHIVQPRISNNNSYKISLRSLKAFGSMLIKAGKRANKPKAPRIPGEIQCRFCPAKADCQALALYSKKAIIQMFEDEKPKSLDTMSLNDKLNLLEKKKIVTDFFNALEKDIYKQLEEGIEIPNYIIRMGQKRKVWKEGAEKKLEFFLGEKTYSKKMISISKATEILGIKKIKPLIEYKYNKPILQKISL